MTTPTVQIQVLQRRPPDLDLDLDLRSDSEDETHEGDRRLRCAACESEVTAPRFAVTVSGHHLHRRTNPAGLEFEFGCFSRAPGATVLGPSTSEHTWFAGFEWSYSLCAACGTHLGWYFDGREPAPFHGLILERLKG